jgi:Mlc titration factor MtfA (ptsG expression regulator)
MGFEETDWIFIAGALFFLFATLRFFRNVFLLILQLFRAQPYYRNLKAIYRPYLWNLKFYKALNAEQKKQFEYRVQFFIDLKLFIPRGGLRQVSDEMKALIASAAIQITFGYPDVYFRHFNRILVYPDKYLNKLTGNYHKGEVNIRGLIVLSVNNLKKGWSNESDGINLGLHEMAHALSIENLVRNQEFNFIDAESVRALKSFALPEMERIAAGQPSLFRKYASANFREFFAVATEVFFEKPDAFKAEQVEMYRLMTQILNLNPLKIYNQNA